MVDLFKEVLPSIMVTKNPVEMSEEFESKYSPFIVNRALSYHVDCVLHVSELNLYPQIDKDMHYNYLMLAIKSKKRTWQTWQKLEKISDIENVKMYFKCSSSKAKAALKILNANQLIEIEEKLNLGGL